RALTAISSLSLHDALPIFPTISHDAGGGCHAVQCPFLIEVPCLPHAVIPGLVPGTSRRQGHLQHWHPPLAPSLIQRTSSPGLSQDRKSTRLNSSHVKSSYA